MDNKLLHTPEGVRDIYNGECAKKTVLENNLFDTIKSYGYNEIQTPTFEYFDIFSKDIGTTPSRELYKFFDKEGETLVLRPDITPSIARCVAKYYMDETMPIRLCYKGNTFINQANYQGRLKETTQIGAELIGVDTPMADGEIIAMIVESLLNSGLKEFQVSIGQVNYFKSILTEAGFDEETEEELRELISIKNYFGVEEFANEKGLSKELTNAFKELPSMYGQMEILEKAKSLTSNKDAIESIDRLVELFEVVKSYGFEKYISFDLGMLSKYKYYTGIIIKAYTYGTGEEVVTGGRYNKLLASFGKNSPSIGFVTNVDALMAAMSRQKIDIPVEDKKECILFTKDSIDKAVNTAKSLRNDGFDVEFNCICSDELDLFVANAKKNGISRINYITDNKVNRID